MSNNILFISSDGETLKGFIVTMSPNKISKNAKPYFNLQVETEDHAVKRAVCYLPFKRRILEEAESSKSGVCITKVETYDNGTIKIGHNSSIKTESLGFKPVYKIEPTKIQHVINEVPLEEIINVSGVVMLNPTESVESHGNDVPVQKGYVCDDSGYIKLVLWREYSGVLENRRSYMLCNVKKVLWSNGIELQSTSSTAYREIEQVADYVQPDDELISHLYNCSIVASKYVHTTKCLMCDEVIAVKDPSKSTIDCPNADCGANTAIFKNEQKYWRIIINNGSSNVKLDVKESLLPNLKADQMQVYFTSHKFDIDYCTVSGAVDKIVEIETNKAEEKKETNQKQQDPNQQGMEVHEC